MLFSQLHHPEFSQVIGILCMAHHHVEDERVEVMSCSRDGGFWEAVVERRVAGLCKEKRREEFNKTIKRIITKITPNQAA